MARTHKQKFNARHGFALNAAHTKSEIAKVADVSVKTVNEVYTSAVLVLTRQTPSPSASRLHTKKTQKYRLIGSCRPNSGVWRVCTHSRTS